MKNEWKKNRHLELEKFISKILKTKYLGYISTQKYLALNQSLHYTVRKLSVLHEVDSLSKQNNWLFTKR